MNLAPSHLGRARQLPLIPWKASLSASIQTTPVVQPWMHSSIVMIVGTTRHLTTQHEARAALISAAADGYATVVVDLSQTAFCDSTGLNVLVRGHKRAAAEGGELRLVIGAASLLRIFSVTGVDRVIPIFTTLAEALGELPAAATQMQPARRQS